MKYPFLVAGIAFTIVFANQSFSAQEQENASVFYDECRIILQEAQLESYENLQDNFCLRIETVENKEYIFTKYPNSIGLPIISQEELSYLKENYYRGEELGVYFKADQEENIENLGYVTQESYELVFLSDTVLQKYENLTKNCVFVSYKATCRNPEIEKFIKQIEEEYSQEVFLDISKILSLTSIELNSLISANTGVQEKIKAIETESDSLYALFSKQYILYKLDINTSILKNRLTDLESLQKYGELKLGQYIKDFESGVQLRQDDDYTYFYLGKNRVNTIENDLEHFDDTEKQSVTQSNLKQKLSDKYKSYSLKNLEKEYVVIEKNFSDSETYIIIDRETFYRYPISTGITETKTGKSGLYVFSKTEDEDSIYLLSDRKVTRLIATQKEIVEFELLIGKIEVTFSDNKTEIIEL